MVFCRAVLPWWFAVVFCRGHFCRSFLVDHVGLDDHQQKIIVLARIFWWPVDAIQRPPPVTKPCGPPGALTPLIMLPFLHPYLSAAGIMVIGIGPSLRPSSTALAFCGSDRIGSRNALRNSWCLNTKVQGRPGKGVAAAIVARPAAARPWRISSINI